MVAQAHVGQASVAPRRDALLRRALLGDAVFCVVAGAVMIAGSSRLSDFTGLSPAWLPAAIGAGVLLWAADLTWIARGANIAAWKPKVVLAANVTWIVASYAIVLGGLLDLTTAGAWTVGILAEIVAIFAVVQYLGYRRAYAL